MRYLAGAERRRDLEREYFEVYHPHDEAMPRLFRWILKKVYRKQGLSGQVDLVRRF